MALPTLLPQPNVSLPHAGLPFVPGATHAPVHVPDAAACRQQPRALSCLGTYNHAAQLTRVNGSLLAAWHNGALVEDAPGSRVLSSWSYDGGHTWSPASTLFEALSPEENSTSANLSLGLNGTVVYSEGFHRFGTRQYAMAAAYNMRCSSQCRQTGAAGSVQRRCCERCLGCCSCPGIKERLPSLMRSVRFLEGGRGFALGPRVWLASRATLQSSYPLPAAERALSSFESLPTAEGIADATAMMRQRLSVRTPRPPPPAQLSERSFWARRASPHKTNNGGVGLNESVGLTLLMRDDGTPSTLREWASVCTLSGLDAEAAEALALGSARGQQPILPAGVDVNCNWSAPLPTNIPDSRSSTCAGALPNGSTYLLGSQLPRLWDRDPLTLALSPDGAAFDSLQAVRADAPPPMFPGFTKGPGYEYPMAVVTEDGRALVAVYSVNKEQIAATRIPL